MRQGRRSVIGPLPNPELLHLPGLALRKPWPEPGHPATSPEPALEQA